MNTRGEASARWLSVRLFLAATFRECPKGEVRRILILGTWVNKVLGMPVFRMPFTLGLVFLMSYVHHAT
jgi:hypothetical protein